MTDARTFNLLGYKALLEEILSHGYQVRDYETAKPYEQHLILRHDVDMSVQAALELARVECDLGLNAVYFVLLRTEMYNLLSERGLADLREIAAMGHEIGLHLDASLYRNEADLEEGAMRECAALEAFLDRPVRTISFHRPAKAFLGRVEPIAGRRHAYEPCFFEEMGYCSDSRGDWHHGHPLDHPAIKKCTALQLLTHPIWWTTMENATVQEKLDAFVSERSILLTEELEANCGSYLANKSPFNCKVSAD